MTALSIGVVAVDELTFGDLLAWVNHAVDAGVTADEPLYDYAGAPLRGLQVRVDVDAAEAASGYGVPWEREDDEPDPQPDANPSTTRDQADPIEQADSVDEPEPEPEPEPSDLAVCPDCGAFVKARGMGPHRRKAHGVVASGAECPDCGQSMMPRNLTRHRGSPACRERQRAGTATDEPDDDQGAGEPEPAASPTPAAGVPSALDAGTAAMCSCGHARRRHEDGDGMCEMPFCECTVYAEAGAA